MPSIRHRTLLAALAAGATLIPAASAAAATNVHVDQTLAQLGVNGLALQGPSPTASVNLALPARFAKAGGTLRLAYEGSPLLDKSSTLQAMVNGRPVTAANVGPGRHVITVPLQRAQVDGADQTLSLIGRLHLRGQDCPPPDAPGAYVRISGTSRLRLAATLASGPLALTALPAALDQRLGSSTPAVTVDFQSTPDAGSVRAAAFALGQVSRVSGYPGVRAVVGLPGQPAPVAPGGVRIMLTERPGPSATQVERRHDGGVDVRLAGPADQLVNAASALAGSVSAKLGGSRATALPPLVAPTADRPIPSALSVGSAGATGLGTVNASAIFRVPEWLELDRGARLETRISWSAPFGGHLRTLVNGLPQTERTLTATGPAQGNFNELLAGVGPQAIRGELRTGDNTLTSSASLAVGAAGTCLPLDAQGGTGVLPGGSLRVRAHARPLAASLAPWPFPVTAQRDGRGATLVLPATPTAGELTSALDSLAEVARWSDEPVLTPVVVGPAALPAGNLLLIARPGAVPDEVMDALKRPAPAGTLASVRQDKRLVTLAVGTQAMAPLTRGVYPGRIAGSVAWVSPTGRIRVLAGSSPLATSAVRDDGVPWRWPLTLIVLGGLLLIVRGILGAHRAMKARTQAAGPPAGSTPGGADGGITERLAAWQARHGEAAS